MFNYCYWNNLAEWEQQNWVTCVLIKDSWHCLSQPSFRESPVVSGMLISSLNNNMNGNKQKWPICRYFLKRFKCYPGEINFANEFSQVNMG